jgi:prolyl-tRNA editing enzyme YbaK/EbsC (Cys-tRNA(Pro) deacylase)/ubiquinone/menaquinone biosynthesis C-methylase UbiE
MIDSLYNREDLSNILLRVVEAKLNESDTLGNVRKVRFGNNPLRLAFDNSLLLEFQGLDPESRYRMLVSFLPLDLMDSAAQAYLERCRELLGFNVAVFWTMHKHTAQEIEHLKAKHVHPLITPLPTRRGSPFESIPDFIHVPSLAYDSLLEVNLLGNEVVKRLRKKFHLVLSELAADNYERYGSFATRQVMDYEDSFLKEVISGMFAGGKGKVAIDVGCGEGRHTRTLAKLFDEVHAIDLSRRMIEAAERKQQRQKQTDSCRVRFYECDIEYEELPEEALLTGKADFVCASFGMPSFVDDTVGFLRRIYKWLRPNGKTLLTFYNSKSLSLSVTTSWKDRALSASLDLARHALEVGLRDDVRFSIYCKALDDRTLDMIRATFAVERIHTFPHLLALLPQSIFGTDERLQTIARDILPRIDKAVEGYDDFGRGHYVFVVGRKDKLLREGHLRVLRLLDETEVEYSIITHAEVVSTREVGELLNLDPKTMVKTVVFKTHPDGQYLVGLVPSSEKVSLHALAKAAKKEIASLSLAPPQEVERDFGFPIGGVSPFGYGEGVPIYIDPEVRHADTDFMYMGIGDNTKTLKLSRENFLRLSSAFLEVNIIDQ